MPNWCQNALSVTGPREEIDKLRGKPFSAQAYLPMPEEFSSIHHGMIYIDGKEYRRWREVNGENVPLGEFEERRLIKQYGSADWHDWAVKNWGTKWDLDDQGIEEKGDGIAIYFKTAWSPPLPLVRTISSLFPSLKFHLTYSEYMGGFEGDFEAQGGQVLLFDPREMDMSWRYEKDAGENVKDMEDDLPF